MSIVDDAVERALAGYSGGGPAIEKPGLFKQGLHAAGAVAGAPKRYYTDALFRAGARNLYGLNVDDNATTGQAIRSLVGLNQGDEGYLGKLAGRGVEFAGDLLTDPLTYASLGAKAAPSAIKYLGAPIAEALPALGRELPAVGRAAQLGFAGLMGSGAIEEGGQAIDTIRRDGFTPEAAEQAFGATLSGLGAGLGAYHLGSSAIERAGTPKPTAPAIEGRSYTGTADALAPKGTGFNPTGPVPLDTEAVAGSQGQAVPSYYGRSVPTPELVDPLWQMREAQGRPVPFDTEAVAGYGRPFAPMSAEPLPDLSSGRGVGVPLDYDRLARMGRPGALPAEPLPPDLSSGTVPADVPSPPPDMGRAPLPRESAWNRPTLSSFQMGSIPAVGAEPMRFNVPAPAIERTPIEPLSAPEPNLWDRVPGEINPEDIFLGDAIERNPPPPPPELRLTSPTAERPTRQLGLGLEPPEPPAPPAPAVAPTAEPILRSGAGAAPRVPRPVPLPDHTVEVGEGFVLLTRPKSPTFSLRGPAGEKVTGRLLPDRIEMVSIGKGDSPNSITGQEALRRLGQERGLPVYFVSNELSQSGGNFRSRMLARGDLIKTEGGLLLRGTGVHSEHGAAGAASDLGQPGRTLGSAERLGGPASSGADRATGSGLEGAIEGGPVRGQSGEAGPTGDPALGSVAERGAVAPVLPEPRPAGRASTAENVPGAVDPAFVPPVGQVKPGTINQPPTSRTTPQAAGRAGLSPEALKLLPGQIDQLKLYVLENPDAGSFPGIPQDAFNAVRDAVHAELAAKPAEVAAPAEAAPAAPVPPATPGLQAIRDAAAKGGRGFKKQFGLDVPELKGIGEKGIGKAIDEDGDNPTYLKIKGLVEGHEKDAAAREVPAVAEVPDAEADAYLRKFAERVENGPKDPKSWLKGGGVKAEWGLDAPALRGMGRERLLQVIKRGGKSPAFLEARTAAKEAILEGRRRESEFNAERDAKAAANVSEVVEPEGSVDATFDPEAIEAEGQTEMRAPQPGARSRKPAEGQQPMFSGSDMLQSTEARVTEGREAQGPLFTQEADAAARAEAKAQGTLFDGDASLASLRERAKGGKAFDLGSAAAEGAGVFKDLATYGASLIERGIRNFPEWSRAMSLKVSGFAKGLKGHLERIYQDSMDTFTRTAKDFGHTFAGVGESTGPLGESQRGAASFGSTAPGAPTIKIGGQGSGYVPPKAPPKGAAAAPAPPPAGSTPAKPKGATAAAPKPPKTTAQKVTEGGFEAWTSGLVSGLGTPISNVVSGGLEMAGRLPEASIAPLVDKWLSQLHGGERTRFSGETGAQIKGGFAALPKAVRTFVDGFKDILGADNEGAIPGTAGKVIRGPLMALKIGDKSTSVINEAAVTPAFALREAKRQLPRGTPQQIEALQQNLIANPTKDLAAAIKKEVAERQFKQGENPRSLVKMLTNMRAEHPWMKVIFPFIETPAAIADLTLQRSPAGFYEAGKAYNAWLKAVKTGAKPDVLAKLKGEAVDKITRPIVGTMILGTFATIAKAGGMTGSGPSDPKDRAALRETGWQPYSFVLGDTYVPFNRFEPISGLLGFAADMVETKDTKSANELFTKALGSIGQNLISKTYLQGLSDAAAAVAKPEQFLSKWVANTAGSLVPNIVAKAAQAADPTVRDVGDEAGFVGLPGRTLKTIESRIPGLTSLVPKRRSGTGEPVEREGNALSRFASPLQVSSREPGAEFQQLLVDIDAVPNAQQKDLVIPGSKGKKVRLTEDELDAINVSDAKATAYLRRVVKSPTFRQMDPEDQKAAVQRIYNQFRTEARQKLYRTPAFARRARATLQEARAAHA